MDPEGSICNPLDLEGMLNDKMAKPRYLEISLLESITKNFSDDLVLGSGGFAVVYKGLLQNGIVVVKMLTQMVVVHEEREQVDCLMRVKHKNIVRFLGYCSGTQGKFCGFDERQRFLCFEYLPGTLDKYMKEQPRGHEWTTCYQIIKGTCEGLHYLHDQKIVHLDLKPANILLDHDMVPKIADFGLSKLFDKDQMHAITSNLSGSQGYMAPEFFGGRITFKSDIYSLGTIIIEILSGSKWYRDIDNVLESWRIKFETSPGGAQLEPVRVCTEIAIECTDFNPAKRPDTWRILESLHEMESTYGVFEMADKAPYSVQGITSAVPMGPGSTSTEPDRGLQKESTANAFNPLERMVTDEMAEPTKLQLSLLKSITDNFSDDLQIGTGGFAVVYKGLLQNGAVAVKKLCHRSDMDEAKYNLEINSLMRVKHKNIIRFLGYCYVSEGEVWNINGKSVMAEERQRFLCFEYLPEGSLDKYIKDASQGLDWITCYQIIRGICDGLHYLHQQNIVHLDLKPANILLDHDKVPKIADFGLSKCFAENQTQTTTLILVGTPGYMAPESYSGLFTMKSDIYSLGVIIIEILTGQKGYPQMNKVLESWATRMGTSQEDTQLEPVRICADIGVKCTQFNRDDRPAIHDILEKLDELERKYGLFRQNC